MKTLLTLFAAVLMSVFATSSHADPAAANVQARDTDATSCRRVVTHEAKEGTVYCGNSGQWAEFDRRVALVNAGITCRWARTARELCMNEKQWKHYDRRVRNSIDAIGMVNGAVYDSGMTYSPSDMAGRRN